MVIEYFYKSKESLLYWFIFHAKKYNFIPLQKEKVMEQVKLIYTLSVFSWAELPEKAKKAIEAAKDASYRAYSPYSNFLVGAAVFLEDGTIVTGNNQENAALPSGLCAERTAIFSANSLYPEQPIDILAIAAQSNGEFLKNPITPCGACRQVLLESEKRFGKEIEIYLYGTGKIYYLKGVEALLPLGFCSDTPSSFNRE